MPSRARGARPAGGRAAPCPRSAGRSREEGRAIVRCQDRLHGEPALGVVEGAETSLVRAQGRAARPVNGEEVRVQLLRTTSPQETGPSRSERSARCGGKAAACGWTSRARARRRSAVTRRLESLRQVSARRASWAEEGWSGSQGRNCDRCGRLDQRRLGLRRVPHAVDPFVPGRHGRPGPPVGPGGEKLQALLGVEKGCDLVRPLGCEVLAKDLPGSPPRRGKDPEGVRGERTERGEPVTRLPVPSGPETSARNASIPAPSARMGRDQRTAANGGPGRRGLPEGGGVCRERGILERPLEGRGLLPGGEKILQGRASACLVEVGDARPGRCPVGGSPGGTGTPEPCVSVKGGDLPRQVAPPREREICEVVHAARVLHGQARGVGVQLSERKAPLRLAGDRVSLFARDPSMAPASTPAAASSAGSWVRAAVPSRRAATWA